MGYWGANEGLLSGLSLHTHLLILLRIAIVLQLLPRISLYFGMIRGLNGPLWATWGEAL